MTPALPPVRPARLLFSSATGLAITALLLGGCASPIGVTTNPPGATAIINNQTLGVTPTQATVDPSKPTEVEFRLDGYFPESFTLQPDPNRKEITVKLEPKTLTKTYQIQSDPDGASVAIDGQPVGTTPATGVKVVFMREDKNSPWLRKSLVISKPNYQTETLALGASVDTLPRISLGLLRDDRVYQITAANTDGAELNAEVTLNGKLVGTTPILLPITFQRSHRNNPWPKFELSVEIPAKYKAATRTLEFSGGTNEAFKLQVINEIVTTMTYPGLVMTPTGVALKTLHSTATAILNTREPTEIVSDLKAVTNFARQDAKDAANSRADSINSFCVSPDGQNVIFGLTEHDEQGSLFSNLFIKRADDAAGGVSRLTQGSRYWDTLPFIANDGSNFLVFASNRSDRNKTDIFRVSLVDNRLSGGVSRLTNDTRFNFAPSYGDSNRQLFYLSTEPNFPTAETQISSIRLDGSLPTQMSITALELNNAFAEKVFFVRVDEDTKKKQIFSITADGKLETALLNLEDYRKSNCFNPAVSPDGTRVLFVSDQGVDEQNRHNNDIYLINSDGSGLQRLTQNGSDDISPAWSPSEEGVVYFLSNRGGAYNIWRMKISSSGAKK